MRATVLNRKVHYWLSLGIALPVLLVLLTGLLLQVKKQVPWVQPIENRGTGKSPTVEMAQILAICQSNPETGIQSWADINRLDIRPSKGLIKVATEANLEVQIDAGTGAILQIAVRRSDWIEALHDGSFFSNAVKYGIFLPSGILLLVMWLTGMILFVQPMWIRWRRKRQAGQSGKSVER
ncbi:PepSY domain-containing protein [Tuwongella immobilis]|uniref:Hypothetical membrane protein n=1 Tax=Tuwongella immobilis TaxID=692036 RepID=A0A6C2YI81_9BACT|nr:PepSY domain-containing protein [Tuwongella immobilis]VIP01127.1 Hypothetical membrane protein OS=Gemmatimonas aurantiaca (strain T-27 / DSM 14586 / JCM 11422 / NBRC 100505) GN=GAU_2321 PE=4 SV=1 [Tuwongella immobilis]VTR97679.1 Hypothetical membrane protein OS=Gemmatimonas aurantiaca (strain T-27 / DSM 14586 / JCM 11422 / NBRC 100505) GN=GAU_2321 PE=4 SV=1 [Tuwongella immobilis]